MSVRRHTSAAAGASARAAAGAGARHAHGATSLQDAPGEGLALAVPPGFVEAVAVRVAALLGAEQHEQHHEQKSPWLDVPETAAYLRCSKHRIYRLVHAQRIPFQKEGARLLFHQHELDKWVRDEG